MRLIGIGRIFKQADVTLKRRTTIGVIAALRFFLQNAPAFSLTRNNASTNLLPSGEPAEQNSPPCTDGYTPTAASVVLPEVYKGFDSYVGFPISQSASEIVPGFNSWVAERFGIANGPSVCASQCIAAPVTATIEICMADGDGRACKAFGNGDGPLGWSGTQDSSQSTSGTETVFCTTGKNWSHDRNRAFWVQATF